MPNYYHRFTRENAQKFSFSSFVNLFLYFFELLILIPGGFASFGMSGIILGPALLVVFLDVYNSLRCRISPGAE